MFAGYTFASSLWTTPYTLGSGKPRDPLTDLPPYPPSLSYKDQGGSAVKQAGALKHGPRSRVTLGEVVHGTHISVSVWEKALKGPC